MSGILFREGYKYVLAADYTVKTALKPPGFILTDFTRLDTDGTLWIRRGYAWDGASGPAIDTANFRRGSLVHDALYQLMREGALERDAYREAADQELYRIVREDGMWLARATWVLAAVRMFGGRAASPDGGNPILTAP